MFGLCETIESELKQQSTFQFVQIEYAFGSMACLISDQKKGLGPKDESGPHSDKHTMLLESKRQTGSKRSRTRAARNRKHDP